jgi:cytoskeletal protein RodZ
MHESFGARLRQRREEQRVSLSSIAEQTKIKLSLLEALERDDVSRWPSGIFRRAYIRAYAHAIGLCPDVTVREFLAVHPDPDEVIGTAGAIGATADPVTTGGPPSRLRFIVGSAIGSLSRLRRSAGLEGILATDVYPANEPPVSQPHAQVADRSRAVAQVDRTMASADDRPTGQPPASEPDVHSAAEPAQETRETQPVTATADDSPDGEPAASDPDFMAVAQLCTALGRVEDAGAMQPLLKEAAEILDATGLIVWLWEAAAGELTPALAHGYSNRVIAQLPGVRRDADNATAAAFRLTQTCAIDGNGHTSGALVVPLLTPAGCTGVLALELPNGRERSVSVRAAATIVAAVVAQLTGGGRPADVLPEDFARPIRVNARNQRRGAARRPRSPAFGS